MNIAAGQYKDDYRAVHSITVIYVAVLTQRRNGSALKKRLAIKYGVEPPVASQPRRRNRKRKGLSPVSLSQGKRV